MRRLRTAPMLLLAAVLLTAAAATPQRLPRASAQGCNQQPGAGSLCGITFAHATRMEAPACSPDGSSITWYWDSVSAASNYFLQVGTSGALNGDGSLASADIYNGWLNSSATRYSTAAAPGVSYYAVVNWTAPGQADSNPVSNAVSQSCGSAPPPAPPTARGYYQVDLSGIANHPLDWLQSPPSGSQSFNGVPFYLRSGSNAVFMTSQRFLENLPTRGNVTVPALTPQNAYVLLSGSYVLQQFRDQQVGELDFSYDDGSTFVAPIIAWQSVREAWCYAADIAGSCTMDSPPSGEQFQNVYREGQSRGGQDARGWLDMLTVQLPQNGARLTGIQILDTSLITVGSVDPSLLVAAITLR